MLFHVKSSQHRHAGIIEWHDVQTKFHEDFSVQMLLGMTQIDLSNHKTVFPYKTRTVVWKRLIVQK